MVIAIIMLKAKGLVGDISEFRMRHLCGRETSIQDSTAIKSVT